MVSDYIDHSLNEFFELRREFENLKRHMVYLEGRIYSLEKSLREAKNFAEGVVDDSQRTLTG